MTWTLTAAQATAMDRALAQARSHCGEVGGTVDADAFLDLVVRKGLETMGLGAQEESSARRDGPLAEARKRSRPYVPNPEITVRRKPAPVEDDGWIPWDGGERPVGGETLVLVRLRSGAEDRTGTGNAARFLRWSHFAPGTALRPFDIVAYKIVKESP